ncbi:hypothetical protein OUZ56_020572 [Daphnia magna]|uniref:Uncharacterized protein n=1 Tax=Daphnia magna TaxID=35525 RepID=A0ABQ9ZFX1_9CRUS|nr:hypothetical protein OUZ56_020572 [Daphnia magna]
MRRFPANFNCYCLGKKCNSFRKPRKLLSSSAVPHNLLSFQLTLGTYCETNRKKNREKVSQMSLVNLVAHRTSCHGMESCSVKTVPSFSQEKEVSIQF